MTDVFKLIEANGLTLHGDIERFAELVRADEREKVIAEFVKAGAVSEDGAIVVAIRARGNA